jgi:hypothetical protein
MASGDEWLQPDFEGPAGPWEGAWSGSQSKELTPFTTHMILLPADVNSAVKIQ